MFRAALLRILVLLAIVVGGTAAISAVLGALSGKSIVHSLAIGYYLAGAAALVGSFIVGSRGQWRTETSDEAAAGASPLRSRVRRSRRRTTSEERAEGRRASIGLFLLGIALVLLGAAVDPSRRAL